MLAMTQALPKRLWYVIHTKPRAEKITNQEILEKGIETYLPLRRTVRQWSDRKKWVEEPLIRSYLFIKATKREREQALQPQGAVRCIHFEGKPAVVREDQIQFLKQLLLSDAEFEVETQRIPEGSKVEVIAGDFIGYTAELVDYLNRTRVLVRFDQIGFAINVSIPLKFVRPVSSLA
jgi:transcription antitermination factor NusG